MSSPDPLGPLRRRFIQRCADDLHWLVSTGPELPLEEAEQRIHRLAGSAALFGFEEVGAAAGRLDEAIGAERRIPGDLLTALLEQLQAVEAAQAA